MKIAGNGKAAVLSKSDFLKIKKLLTGPHKLIWELSYYTGERAGAIVQLNVEDVFTDPRRREPGGVILYRAKTRKGTKSGGGQTRYDTREVQVSQTLRDILRAYDTPLTGFLFPSPRNQAHHITWGAYYKAVAVAAELAGLVGVSTHSPRRSLITTLHNRGIAVKVIQKITGHHDVRALLGYVEVTDNQMKEAMDLI